MSDDPYVRVYYSIRNDPRFDTIYGDDSALAAWLRLLMAADAIWPAPADVPKWVRREPFRKLVAAGLIEVNGDHYRIHGLDAERTRRSVKASNAAGARWSNAASNANSNAPSNAKTMPLRAEPSRAEQSQAEQEQDDPVSTYYLLTTRTPRGRALDWCKRLGEQYGYRATSDAMSDAWGDSDEVGTLLSRTEDKLVLASRSAERAERAEELARLREKRERRFIPVEAPDPQKVADIMGELRERLTARTPEDAA
jgi:hypothetical protein